MSEDFRSDIAEQGAVVRRILEAYADGGALRGEIATAVLPLREASGPIVMVGMGSSLHAARCVVPRLWSLGRNAAALDAGELLHYGQAGLDPDAVVIAISQSGRSAETVALVTELRAADPRRPIIAVVNDVNSPLAAAASVIVDIRAGTESAVATRTFVATNVLLHLLADHLLGGEEAGSTLAALADELDEAAADTPGVMEATDGFWGMASLVLVGRGPTLGLAGYGALTIEETAAMPAEALSGGAFRHGPLELVDAPAGAIILIDDGPTQHLARRLVDDISAAGWPTWVIGTTGGVAGLSARREHVASRRLIVTAGSRLGGPLACLPFAVPLQRLAASLAGRRDRVPGVLLHGSKVTLVQ